jgi:hypothetical protein
MPARKPGLIFVEETSKRYGQVGPGHLAEWEKNPPEAKKPPGG